MCGEGPLCRSGPGDDKCVNLENPVIPVVRGVTTTPILNVRVDGTLQDLPWGFNLRNHPRIVVFDISFLFRTSPSTSGRFRR